MSVLTTQSWISLSMFARPPRDASVRWAPPSLRIFELGMLREVVLSNSLFDGRDGSRGAESRRFRSRIERFFFFRSGSDMILCRGCGVCVHRPQFSSCCFLAPLVPLRFVAQNLRIPVTSSSVNLFQQQPTFDSFHRVFVFDVTAHCHLQCARAHLANRASHTKLLQTLFRGVMTPSLTPVRPGHRQLLDGLP